MVEDTCSASMERHNIGLLVGVNALNDVDLANRILLKVVRPATKVNRVSTGCAIIDYLLRRPDAAGSSRHVLNISN